MDRRDDNGTLEQHSKREAQGLRREREKLERSLGGIKAMEALPDVLFVIDVGHEKIAIHEAQPDTSAGIGYQRARSWCLR